MTHVPNQRVRDLAELLVNHSLDVQPRWQVTVRSSSLGSPLVAEVARALARRGAYALTRLSSGPLHYRIDYDWAQEAPLELLEELAPIERHAIETEDARLAIRAPEADPEGPDLGAERRSALQTALAPAMARTRSFGVRWAVAAFPTETASARAGLSLPEFEDFVYGACLLDWDEEEAHLTAIKERFDRAKRIRIVADETDLTLSIDGRAGTVCAGLLNMPDGEVFYSPIEDSADGVISYREFPAGYLGREATNVRLSFREGRVVEATAEEGQDFLLEMLDSDDGARRLGELGLGCNRKITRFTRDVLFDEKIAGTVHLALGASYGSADGRNQSAIHWDIVKDLRPGGELWCDDVLVQTSGRWLI